MPPSRSLSTRMRLMPVAPSSSPELADISGERLIRCMGLSPRLTDSSEVTKEVFRKRS